MSEEASRVQQRLANVILVVDRLAAEINSTRLVPRERIVSANDTLTRLLSQVEAFGREVDSAEQQVDSLERQTDQLKKRYTELLQHRDLLLRLRDTVTELGNCQ